MRYRIIHCITALVTYFLLNGCVNLGPDYRKPDANIDIPGSYQHAPADLNPLEVEDRWWMIFGDSQLDGLVEQVLQNNWDVKQAAARVLETRARYVQVRADRFPSVGVEGTWDRRRFGGARAARGMTIDTYELAAPAFFEIDLWSRLAKTSKAAWDDILQEEENRHTVAQTIVA